MKITQLLTMVSILMLGSNAIDLTSEISIDSECAPCSCTEEQLVGSVVQVHAQIGCAPCCE